jgi:hypothetical protein
MPKDMIGCTCGYHPLIEIELKNTLGYDIIVGCPKCGKKNRSTTKMIEEEREEERKKFNKNIKDLEKQISDLQALVEADKGTKPPKLTEASQETRDKKSVMKGKAKMQPKDPEASDEEEEPEDVEDLNELEAGKEIADAEVEEREKESIAKAEEKQTEDGGDFLDDDEDDDDEENDPDIPDVGDDEE